MELFKVFEWTNDTYVHWKRQEPASMDTSYGKEQTPSEDKQSEETQKNANPIEVAFTRLSAYFYWAHFTVVS